VLQKKKVEGWRVASGQDTHKQQQAPLLGGPAFPMWIRHGHSLHNGRVERAPGTALHRPAPGRAGNQPLVAKSTSRFPRFPGVPRANMFCR
jgi:hypothetical protein